MKVATIKRLLPGYQVEFNPDTLEGHIGCFGVVATKSGDSFRFSITFGGVTVRQRLYSEIEVVNYIKGHGVPNPDIMAALEQEASTHNPVRLIRFATNTQWSRVDIGVALAAHKGLLKPKVFPTAEAGEGVFIPDSIYTTVRGKWVQHLHLTAPATGAT